MLPPGNTRVWKRMIAYTPTLVSSPANTAVTGAGAVGYESGSQVDSGKTAALMPNATRNTAKMVLRRPSGTSAIRVASCARLRVPAAE